MIDDIKNTKKKPHIMMNVYKKLQGQFTNTKID